MVVIVLGVIATTGVYGSRMAWLLGVACPLLAVAALLAWRATRLRASHGSPAGGTRHGVAVPRLLLVASLVLLGIPAGLAAVLLSVYALILVVHGIGLLR